MGKKVDYKYVEVDDAAVEEETNKNNLLGYYLVATVKAKEGKTNIFFKKPVTEGVEKDGCEST